MEKERITFLTSSHGQSKYLWVLYFCAFIYDNRCLTLFYSVNYCFQFIKVFKRKGKSIAAEGSQNSEEDESRNVKRSPLVPVQRTSDPTRTSDSVSKTEVDYGSAAGNASLASAETGKQDVSSIYKSPQNASDEETGTDIRPAQRTLPGYCVKFLFFASNLKEI